MAEAMGNTSAAIELRAGAEPARQRGGLGVMLALLSAAGALGVVAYWRFVESERALGADLARMARRAPLLGVEGCVGEVLAWNGACAAMKSLCDATVPRMMETCLRGVDRSADCAVYAQRVMATSFGVGECRARGRGRRDKPCALAYRSIAAHCLAVAQGARR
jgi:hypothetical protein